MIAVVQRVVRASVEVEGQAVGHIGRGLAVLVAVEVGDDLTTATKCAERLTTLRIFPNGDKAYDLTAVQAGGGFLVISNFTVAADTASGRRPGLSPAARPDVARPIFEHLLHEMRRLVAGAAAIETGRFGTEMAVALVNDGPCTVIVRVPPPAHALTTEGAT